MLSEKKRVSSSFFARRTSWFPLLPLPHIPEEKKDETHQSHDVMACLQILSQDILLPHTRVGIDRVRNRTALDRSHLSSHNLLLLLVSLVLSCLGFLPRCSSSQSCRARRRPSRKSSLRIVILFLLLFSDF